MISALQHPNLVKLYGCGIEGNQLLLVYEYMENNSLARALFGESFSWHAEHQSRNYCSQVRLLFFLDLILFDYVGTHRS